MAGGKCLGCSLKKQVSCPRPAAEPKSLWGKLDREVHKEVCSGVCNEDVLLAAGRAGAPESLGGRGQPDM